MEEVCRHNIPVVLLIQHLSSTVPTMKRITLLISSLVISSALFATENISVGKFNLMLDTVSHTKIGPGSTLTQLHLSGEHPLDVHYVTVDLTTPGVSLRAARGSSSNGLEKTSGMAQRLSTSSLLYFAGVNGDFFDVTTTYPDGTSRPRLSTYTSIIDGKVHKTSPQGHQFIFDSTGIPYIDLLDFCKGSLTHAGKSVAFGGVNVESINYSGDTAADNSVTIYTPDGWRSPCQTQYAGNCCEVCAKLKEGDSFSTTSKYSFIITSVSSTTGDLPVPQDGYVLLGRGAGKSFIEGLKVGDEVEVENFITLKDGDRITPLLSVGGNPVTVKDGVAQESDGSRPDAVDFHPRTGAGISRDGKKVIMMVIDGRGKSLGATTRMLGDMLVYAGAWNGLNFDGGGSSTCYTSPFGVVNTCSDANGERTVQNSLFATVSGDVNDKKVAEIRFADFKKTLFSNDNYIPVIYGYNRAGVLVDKDLKGVSFTCDPSMGEISGDGSAFKATGSGMGVLRASYGDMTATLIIDVKATKETTLCKDFSAWNRSLNQVKVTSATSDESIARIEYQMATSVASAKIALSANKELYEDCVGVALDFASASALKKIELTFKTANDDSSVVVTKSDCTTAGNEWRIQLSDIFDISNPQTFPLRLNLLSLYPGDLAKSTGYVEFSKLASVNLLQCGFDEILADDYEDKPEYYTISGIRVAKPSTGIFICRRGAKVSKILIK